MNKDKIVTFEMFKKYHEHLMGFIENGDGFEMDEEDVKEAEDIEE